MAIITMHAVKVIHFESNVDPIWKIGSRRHAYYTFITFYILYAASWDRKWGTYDYQENEVYPVPEGMGVLHVIHYVRPSFQTNYLQIGTITSRRRFNEITTD